MIALAPESIIGVNLMDVVWDGKPDVEAQIQVHPAALGKKQTRTCIALITSATMLVEEPYSYVVAVWRNALRWRFGEESAVDPAFYKPE